MDAYICVRIAGKKLLCMSKKYHPEEYWTEVADRIASRKDENVIAGDDEPYYRYKRKKFLNLLHQVPFKGKTVLVRLRKVDHDSIFIGRAIANDQSLTAFECVFDSCQSRVFR